MKNTNDQSSAEILRQKAEELLSGKSTHPVSQYSDADKLKLIHELEVHQIELELQNVEFMEAKRQADAAVDQYTELYDFAPSGYFTLSNEGKIVKLNLCASQMLGKERAHLINRLFGLFVSIETKPTFNLFLGNLFDSKIKTECEITLLSDSNSSMIVHLSGIVFGEGTHCLLTATDITDRKQAQKSILDSEEKYRLLAEHMKDVVWLMDMDFKVIYQSPSSEKLRGFTSEEMKNLPIEKTLTPESLKRALENFQREMPRIMHDPEYSPLTILELEYYCKDGTTIWLENKFSIIRNAKDRSLSILGEGRDITDRRRAEDTLKRSYALLEVTLESIHNGILVVSAQGKVIKTNATFAKMWNVPDDLLARGEDSLLLEFVVNQLSDPGEFISKVGELYGKPESETFDHIYFKDGRVFERISKPMYLDGLPQGRIWSFLDITAMINKNEELVKANAEKDKFFSIIAHDLRSPFNAFLGFTQMLVEELDTFSLSELQKIALSMRKSATNLFGLLENLLEWSRLRRGITNFEPETFLLKSFGEESLKSVFEPADKKGIQIRYEIPENIEVYADRYMLGSTLRNLVSNSIKFTHPGGFITIAAKYNTDNSVQISINDTGIGMNKNMSENLFRLDEQTNRKGTEGEPSTGLGLIICKEFIEKHGGKVWVESEVGQGSVFCFTIQSHL